MPIHIRQRKQNFYSYSGTMYGMKSLPNSVKYFITEKTLKLPLSRTCVCNYFFFLGRGSKALIRSKKD